MQRNRLLGWLPLSLALLVFAFSAMAPLQAVPMPTCYHCTLVNGSFYDCSGGNSAGGNSCNVTGDSCTVIGICSTGTDAVLPVAISETLIREVAQVHPRLAASLWRLGSAGAIEPIAEIHWLAGLMTSKDVDVLLAGGKLAMPTEPGEVVYKASVVRSMDGATATLVISPANPTGKVAEADFSYFELSLKLDTTAPGSKSALVETYIPDGWSMY